VVKLQNSLTGTDSLTGLPKYELAPYLELVCRLWIQQITTQGQQMAVAVTMRQFKTLSFTVSLGYSLIHERNSYTFSFL